MNTMDNMYKSATLKMTVQYLALVMAISLIFSAVIYHFATDALAWGLHNQTARIYEEFPVFSDNPFFVHDNDVDISAHRILLNLAYFNVLVLVVAGFVSYWLARLTLRPIEAASEQQKRFVADASHELRTPVTALKMSTEVALMDTGAPKSDLRQALASNLEEANKLETLLNSLLRLSHLEANGMELHMAEIAVTDILRPALERVEKSAAAKRISINNTIPTNGSVAGDEASLIQVLVILLDNAIKYSPARSTVTVTSQTKGNETTVTVSDPGVGIKKEALEHVFDRFYRADNARSGDNGYGLGLAIAKHIMDLHHGTITLTSTHGKGTRASITLASRLTD